MPKRKATLTSMVFPRQKSPVRILMDLPSPENQIPPITASPFFVSRPWPLNVWLAWQLRRDHANAGWLERFYA